jgi:hypothetical protein
VKARALVDHLKELALPGPELEAKQVGVVACGDEADLRQLPPPRHLRFLPVDVAFFIAGTRCSVSEREARWLAGELARLHPDQEEGDPPGDATAAAIVIKHALEGGGPVELGPGERYLAYRVLDVGLIVPPRPERLLTLRSALREALSS